jgi:ribosomal protein L35AE/L33A
VSSWSDATGAALAAVRQQVLAAAAAANQQVIEAGHPSSVVRSIDGVDGAADAAFAITSRIVFRYRYMAEVVRSRCRPCAICRR